MPAKARNLFDSIASFPALREAAFRAAKGKLCKPGVAAFLANLEKEVLRLERELRSGSYRPGRYTVIEVFDPKHRMVSAAPFRDRVVHHAFCSVCEPIFERGFIFDTYANRKGKGTHRAVVRYEKFRDRFRHVLRCDIYRYFPAIDHAILKRDLRRRLACERTLDLADRIIDGSNPQEPVNLHFPADDLFTPFERRRGLPIGNLTSQFFSNLYLDGFDHFCKEVLRAKGYVRYVDDFALFHDNPDQLAEWRRRIERFPEGRRLRLHPDKTHIAPTSEPATFLGFVLLPGGCRRLPEENVRRFRNRLRGLRDRWRHGTVTQLEVEQRVRAWIAHAEHAQTWRLRHAIFRAGWFDPVPAKMLVARRGAIPTDQRFKHRGRVLLRRVDDLVSDIVPASRDQPCPLGTVDRPPAFRGSGRRRGPVKQRPRLPRAARDSARPPPRPNYHVIVSQGRFAEQLLGVGGHRSTTSARM